MIRVLVKGFHKDDPDREAIFCGLINQNDCDRCGGPEGAVVRYDGHGMMVAIVHPSRVEFIQKLG